MVLPLRYLGRNPFLKVSRLYHPLTSEEGDVAVYRISPPEAWRVVRARLRQELGKNANPGEINEAGFRRQRLHRPGSLCALSPLLPSPFCLPTDPGYLPSDLWKSLLSNVLVP